VPSCPGWNAGQLLRHLGGHRWAEEIVRTRATGLSADKHFRDLSAYTGEDATHSTPGSLKRRAVGAGPARDRTRRAGVDPGARSSVRGPLTDLVLIVYLRRRPHSDGAEVAGDKRLLDFWLDRVGFG
jgi:hypothetical protein